MTYNLQLTRRGETDIDGILSWLRDRSPQGAAAWYRVWTEVLGKLREQASAYGLAPENADHEHEIRHVVFKTRRGGPYRALFMIRNRDVFVLHVRGPGQDVVRPNDLEVPESS
jgi:plasmid stabilization system protein ParE